MHYDTTIDSKSWYVWYDVLCWNKSFYCVVKIISPYVNLGILIRTKVIFPKPKVIHALEANVIYIYGTLRRMLTYTAHFSYIFRFVISTWNPKRICSLKSYQSFIYCKSFIIDIYIIQLLLIIHPEVPSASPAFLLTSFLSTSTICFGVIWDANARLSFQLRFEQH